MCSDKCTRFHTEIELADQTIYLAQSQYTDTGPTSPSTDPITPGVWQGSHRSATFEVAGMTRTEKKKKKIPTKKAGIEPRVCRSRSLQRDLEGIEEHLVVQLDELGSGADVVG